MEEITSASDAFLFDEDKAMSIKEFFTKYRDKFPMLAIMVDGICGDTPYDCYDCYQVFRIHGYTSQPRVVAIDSSEGHMQRYSYITIPVNTDIRFKVVKNHSSVGAAKSLEEILSENELPVLVEMNVGPSYTLRAPLRGKSLCNVGLLLITARFDEHYLMINCIDSAALTMNKANVLVSMSGALTATTIDGFKYKSDVQFAAFLTSLDEIVATSEEVYDLRRGNSDLDICRLDNQEIDPTLVTTKTDIFPPTDEPPPPIPSRKGDDNEVIDDSGGIYYEIPDDWEPKPDLSPRKHNKSKATPVQKAKPAVERKGVFRNVLDKLQRKHFNKMDKSRPDEISEKSKAVNIAERNLEACVDAYHSVNDNYEELGSRDSETGNIIYMPLSSDNFVKNTAVPSDVQPGARNLALSNIPDVKHDQTPGLLKIKLLAEKAKTMCGDGAHENGEATYLHGHDSIRNKHVRTNYDSRKVVSITNTPQYKNTNIKTGSSNQTTEDITTIQSGVSNSRRSEVSEHKPEVCGGKVDQYDINKMSIDEIGSVLLKLRLGKYAIPLREQMIDGAILSQLTADDFVNELGFTKVEAIRLETFGHTGHIPH